MKKTLNFILTILTILMLLLLTFSKINSLTNWVDLSDYEKVIGYIADYGPMVLLCFFAFGSLFGKVMSKIFFILIVLLLIVFTIVMFAPNLVESIFGSLKAVFNLMRF